MKYKYEEPISGFSHCVINSCLPKNKIAYRWTFESIQNTNNFIPRYLTSAYESLPKDDCIGYALSMFDEEDRAIARLNKICEGKKYLYKKLGTHLSKGILLEKEGVCSDSDENGHFSFFEAAEVDLSSSFTVIKPIMQ